MKKTNLLVLSVAAALLATSCSKDQVSEVNPGEAIRFSALTGSATKAAEVTSANLAEYKVYGVYATSTSLNFTDTYTKGGEDGSTWTSTGGTHYWPIDKAENVTFFAHSPANLETAFPGSSIGTPATNSFSISNVIIPEHASNHKDLVYARYQGNRAGTTGAVPLVLKHVFSQIELQALCSDANMKVTVYGAKLFGLKDQSTLTFPTANTVAGSEPTMIWGQLASDPKAYLVGRADNPNPVVLGTDAAPIMGANGNGDGNFMVIPQDMTTEWNPTDDPSNAAKGGYIGVLCKIEKANDGGGYTQIFPTDGSANGYTAVPIRQNFQKNKKYSIILKFFTSGGGGGVIDPDDPDNPGQPILAPITFNVSVTDWETPTSVEKPLS